MVKPIPLLLALAALAGSWLAAPAASLAAFAGEAAETAQAANGGGDNNNIFAGDIGNALWTVIIFVAVLWVLGKYAWGPLLKSLQERESFIRESLEKARRDRDEAEARLREYEERLAGARVEATAIVEQSRRDADAVRREIEEHAKHEAQRILERARRDVEIATQAAAHELYTMAGKLATEIAARIIGRELTPQDHERLIAESIADLQARRN
jgi:F-type H+-transporting ATPase subunit b